MAKTFKFGENGKWATKTGSSMAYNDQNGNFKPMPFSVTRDSIATRVNKEGLIEVVGKDKLRIDYKDSSNGVALLEIARTNLIAYSNKFDVYWSLSGLGTGSAPVLNNNSIISPDGSQNATEVILDVGSGTTTSDRSSIEVSQTVSQGSEYTISFYLKGKNNGDQLMIGAISGGYELITLTTEWERYSITQTAASSPRSVFIGIRQGVFGTLNNNVEFYLFGAQLELGSYPTSYIPTQGETNGVTRSADVANGAGNAQVFNDSEGVLFANIAALANDGTTRYIAVSDGSNDERVQVIFSTSGNISLQVVSSNTDQASATAIGSQIQYSKLAIKYKLNDCSFWYNGFKIHEDSSAVMPSGLDTLGFERPTGVSQFYGKTKEIGVYDAVLTDAELEALTSYTSFTNMANELNLTIK